MMAHPDPASALPPVAGALRDARLSVLAYWQRREDAGHGVREEELTSRLVDAADPVVESVEFNPSQEGVVGADWLWWFIQDDGTCFGLLVQAKKLNGSVGSWSIDLGYPGGKQRWRQMTRLLATADQLEVPAAYVLYFGARKRRPDIACSDKDAPDCWRCERASIALLPALVAQRVALLDSEYHPESLPSDAYRHSLPMEDLGLADSAPIRDLNLEDVGPALRTFLTTEQSGPEAVAKRIFRIVSDYRKGMLSAVVVGALAVGSTDLMFDEVPSDTGHYGVSYFEHVLRGLRRQPPAYVTELLGTSSPADTPSRLEGLSGLVIVHL